MLNDPAPRILIPAKAASQAAATRAIEAAAAIDVLGAETEQEAAEAMARALRAGLKVRATDLALRGIVDRLEAGRGSLDDLLKVVGALDPDSERTTGSPTIVAVEVVVKNER